MRTPGKMTVRGKLRTDDVRIRELRELNAPQDLLAALPCDDRVAELVVSTRRRLHDILHGADDRLIVVIGPCSIHDPKAALAYARRLLAERERHSNTLEIVMRVYFEKPRTTVGWKGLINDPWMDETFDINEGLRLARTLLLELGAIGMPAGSEFLDTISPQYIADLIAWGAIGARTTESQVHRELASGLSCPVGFKNGTDGNITIALDAIKAAAVPHHFLSVTKSGQSAIVSTTGNDDCHLILRGGKTPNYDARSVEDICARIARAGLEPRVMIDASHGNSEKIHARQLDVCDDVCAQIGAGDRRMAGVMLESFLVAGRQNHVAGKELTFGQSITDACLGWDESAELLQHLSDAVASRRNSNAANGLRA